MVMVFSLTLISNAGIQSLCYCYCKFYAGVTHTGIMSKPGENSS